VALYLQEKFLNPSQIERMKLAVAIREVCATGKKMIFKEIRAMKNGATWLCYLIDGVKCSTFASAIKIQWILRLADIRDTALAYASELANQMDFKGIHKQQHGYTEVVMRDRFNERVRLFVFFEGDQFYIYKSHLGVGFLAKGESLKSMLQDVEWYLLGC